MTALASTAFAANSLASAAPASRARRWAARIVTGLPVVFLMFDIAIKLANHPSVAEVSQKLGMPPHQATPIALLLAACLALYLIPRTAVLGAVLLTGYLGGAVYVHLRVENPLFSHTLFPIYVGALLWIGLYLRDARVRALLAPR